MRKKRVGVLPQFSEKNPNFHRPPQMSQESGNLWTVRCCYYILEGVTLAPFLRTNTLCFLPRTLQKTLLKKFVQHNFFNVLGLWWIPTIFFFLFGRNRLETLWINFYATVLQIWAKWCMSFSISGFAVLTQIDFFFKSQIDSRF